MRAVSLPPFHVVPSPLWIVVLAAVVILGSVLLVFAADPFASLPDPSPDGQLFGPFRWRHSGAMSTTA